jgi:hypothetical protein
MDEIYEYKKNRNKTEDIINERDVIKWEVIKNQVGKHWKALALTHVVVKIGFRCEIQAGTGNYCQYA